MSRGAAPAGGLRAAATVGAAAAALSAGALLAARPAQAGPAPGARPLPLWEVGAAGVAVSQQAYPGSDQQVRRALALPFVVYRGDVLRADDDSAGLRALKTERFELDVGVAGAFGARSDDIDARRGMRDLGTLVEFGPRLRWNLTGPERSGDRGRWRLELPLRGVFDLSDGLRQRGATLEPELVFERRARGGWRYQTGVSAILADRRLARDFYGVTPAEALPGRPAYAARAGLVAWRLSLSSSVPLGPDWTAFGFARVDDVSAAANRASPLVRQDVGASVGIGLAWTWKRSASRGVE